MLVELAEKPIVVPVEAIAIDRAMSRLDPYLGAESAIVSQWLRSSCFTPKTLKTYVDHFQNLVRFVTEHDSSLLSIEPEGLQSWANLSSALADSSQRLRRAVAESFYSYVSEHVPGFIDPTLDLRPVSGRAPEHTKYLSADALDALFATLRVAVRSGDLLALRDQELIRSGIGFGLRNEELAGQLIGDLYQRATEVRRQIRGKGVKLASTAMPEGALHSFGLFLDVLEARTGNRPNGRWAAFPGLGPKQMAEMRAGGIPTHGWRLTTRAVHMRVAGWFTRAKIAEPGLSVHSLRATFAVLLYESGCPLDVIQRLMRHAKLETTQLYLSRLLDHRADEAIRDLDGRLTAWMSGNPVDVGNLGPNGSTPSLPAIAVGPALVCREPMRGRAVRSSARPAIAWH